MFEPHLGMNDPSGGDNKSFNDDSTTSAKDLLAELDRIAPIKAFDAFPKVSSYDCLLWFVCKSECIADEIRVLSAGFGGI